jgi:hypothetical protein
MARWTKVELMAKGDQPNDRVQSILDKADEYYFALRDVRGPREHPLPEEVMWRCRFRALVMALVEELG